MTDNSTDMQSTSAPCPASEPKSSRPCPPSEPKPEKTVVSRKRRKESIPKHSLEDRALNDSDSEEPSQLVIDEAQPAVVRRTTRQRKVTKFT